MSAVLEFIEKSVLKVGIESCSLRWKKKQKKESPIGEKSCKCVRKVKEKVTFLR